MDGIGEIEAIHIADESAAETDEVDAVEAVAGSGLRGDRHFDPDTSGDDITLIETEALDAIEAETGIALGPGEHRRNVTTRNAALNHLVGKRFRVGDAICEGVELCEPCSHLESLTEKGTLAALVHRGGLRASIVESGEIRVGDGVTQLS
ncbi:MULTISPECIES: MOSC domain-containing protein [unclassified Haladaptatus]|uniref:MOSC domain-containing protein n=1 Tax=unclassified Haladaptatus TaxID=2622732 RepID=UPI00209C39E2|nr:MULTISPECIES: MOSC domain-containing protein [unclassified Haladaptatus]MCO8242734.1 MOSC domain-containing protein [Haladaptatus sp. AB643]MCO8252493.1 MOSC domain-containing protein [Haladaptatus sp. AB618]